MAGTATAESRSFAKALFAGRIEESLVFPYPRMAEVERARVASLIGEFRAFAAERIDPERIDRDERIEDDVRAGLARLGFYGLYIPRELGGLGLSQTGYCRVFEEIARVSPS